MKKIYLFGWVLFLAFGISACKTDPVEPDDKIPYDPTPYTLEIPRGFPDMPIPDENPTTEEGVKLGKMLYYDNILSMNGLACSSCHVQSTGFSAPQPGPAGTGILPHVNLGWRPEFGWIGGEDLLDHVALADLEDNNIFLNANSDSILARLTRHPQYPDLFEQAFGIDILTVPLEKRKEYISFALAQFMRTQISGDSRYDKVHRMEPGGTFTQSEYSGYLIFFSERGDCFHCHQWPLMTANSFHNNGLDSFHSGGNLGRYLQTGDSADIGKFIAPTLRNIELTAPYMHDGRFQTLDEVVDHYDSYVLKSPTLDPIMTKPGKEFGLNLSEQDKKDLVAFLKVLTDSAFIHNPDLASPF